MLRTRTDNKGFSIRWQISLAFLLIVGLSFTIMANSLTNMVGDYLFEQRIRTDGASVPLPAMFLNRILLEKVVLPRISVETASQDPVSIMEEEAPVTEDGTPEERRIPAG